MQQRHHFAPVIPLLMLCGGLLAACSQSDEGLATPTTGAARALDTPKASATGGTFGTAEVRAGAETYTFKVVDCRWPDTSDDPLLVLSAVAPGVPDTDARQIAATDPRNDPAGAQRLLERAYAHGPVLSLVRIKDYGDALVITAGTPQGLVNSHSDTHLLSIEGEGRAGARVHGQLSGEADGHAAPLALQVQATCP